MKKRAVILLVTGVVTSLATMVAFADLAQTGWDGAVPAVRLQTEQGFSTLPLSGGTTAEPPAEQGEEQPPAVPEQPLGPEKAEEEQAELPKKPELPAKPDPAAEKPEPPAKPDPAAEKPEPPAKPDPAAEKPEPPAKPDPTAEKPELPDPAVPEGIQTQQGATPL